MNTKHYPLIFGLLVVLLVVTACGGAPKESETPFVPPEPAEPAPPVEPPAPEGPASSGEYEMPASTYTAREEGAPVPQLGAPSKSNYSRDDEPYDMFFEDYGVNPIIDTEDDQFSTFALDVDTGSYTVMRNYINDGYLPPEESVRVEEYVNYFEQGYPSTNVNETSLRSCTETSYPWMPTRSM